MLGALKAGWVGELTDEAATSFGKGFKRARTLGDEALGSVDPFAGVYSSYSVAERHRESRHSSTMCRRVGLASPPFRALASASTAQPRQPPQAHTTS